MSENQDSDEQELVVLVMHAITSDTACSRQGPCLPMAEALDEDIFEGEQDAGLDSEEEPITFIGVSAEDHVTVFRFCPFCGVELETVHAAYPKLSDTRLTTFGGRIDPGVQ